MSKKLLLMLVFFGFIDVVLISCCKDSPFDYTKFNSLSLAHAILNDKIQDSSTVNQSNYRIKLTLAGEFIVSTSNHQLFMNNSYATSCQNMGALGLKSDITRFELTCNKIIFGVPPGGLIDLSFVKAYEFNFFDDTKNKRLTINEWLNILNNGGNYRSYYDLLLEFTEDIVSNEYLKFKIFIEFQDGSILQAETGNVRVL